MATGGGELWVFRALMLLTGFSMISVQLPNQTVAFAQVTHAETGHASSLYNANRRFGAAIGVATLSSILAAGTAGAHVSVVGYRVAFAVTGVFWLAVFVCAVLMARSSGVGEARVAVEAAG